jgi:hypothetical protein
MQAKIGKIAKVPLRELWRREDADFTRWLEKNIDYLNDVLDLDLSIIAREKEVGPFKVDLYAEDGYGHKVIIENQLKKTNHEHLGKIITYLTNLEANTAIWITSDPVDEHVEAIEWLNEYSPGDISFYLIKVEAIKIGLQPIAAPLFTVISGPSEESKQFGGEKKEYAERHLLRKEFWANLLEKAKEKTDLFSNVSAGTHSWIATGAGKSGIRYGFYVTYRNVGCEIYFDRGKEFVEPNINKKRFDSMYKHKNEIEKEFGGKLKWERLENRRASRISIAFEGKGLKDKGDWYQLQEMMIDAMIRLERATKKYIMQLD